MNIQEEWSAYITSVHDEKTKVEAYHPKATITVYVRMRMCLVYADSSRYLCQERHFIWDKLAQMPSEYV
uniref:Uncharacterized protein n=1 Tax=Sphaerodactylus townsendi TaxID=933632 RepID=A0ACB8FB47_9SAUR